jgi:plastocyanin
MRIRLALALWLLTPAAALAGDLAVTVRTPGGAPVADAVVSVQAPFAGPIKFTWPYRMAQQNIHFDPFVLVVPVGADVAFPNLDKVRHHVYSFSPAKTFELKLYGQDQTRVVHFDKLGVVELGCNIHDVMTAFIDVVETPYVAKTDAHGVAVLHGVPAGPQTVKVWRPYLKAPGNTLSQAVQVPRDGAAELTVTGEVHAPAEHHEAY